MEEFTEEQMEKYMGKGIHGETRRDIWSRYN